MTDIFIRKKICRKTIDFIKLRESLLLELRENYFREKVYNHEKLIWNISQTEFIELVRFLVKTKIISKKNEDLSIKEAVEILSGLFDLKITGIYSKISKSKHRKSGRFPKVYQIWTTYQQSETYLSDE